LATKKILTRKSYVLILGEKNDLGHILGEKNDLGHILGAFFAKILVTLAPLL
jgi:hypothetical protein